MKSDIKRVGHNVTLSNGNTVWVSYIVDLDYDDEDGHVIASIDQDSIHVDGAVSIDDCDEARSLIHV